MLARRIVRVCLPCCMGLLGCAFTACADVWSFDELQPRPDGAPGLDSGGREDVQGAPVDAGEEGDSSAPVDHGCTTSPISGCDAGENCVLGSGDKLTCVPPGLKKINDSCKRPDDCIRGFACVMEEGAYDGLCISYCNVAADCPTRAHEWSCGLPTPQASVKICLADCDPRGETTGCGPDGMCDFVYPFNVDNPTRCVRKGEVTAGGECSGAKPCAPGHACTTAGCGKWCRIGFNSEDCDGKTCLQFAGRTQPSIRGTKFGVCAF